MALINEKRKIIDKLLDSNIFVEEIYKFIEPRLKREELNNITYKTLSGKNVDCKNSSKTRTITRKDNVPIQNIMNFAVIDDVTTVISTDNEIYELANDTIINKEVVDKYVYKTSAKFLSLDDNGNLKYHRECVIDGRNRILIGVVNLRDVKFGLIRNKYFTFSTEENCSTVDGLEGQLKYIYEKYPKNIYMDDRETFM
jgi:hypothetical protein